MNAHLPLFLASASPRRRQLLREAGIDFDLFAVPVDEDALTATYSGALDGLGEFLASHKARAARDALQAAGRHGLVLASDTTVLFEGESLAKPHDSVEARSMLEKLRGREHLVATGVALGSTGTDEIVIAASVTRVLMREYGDDEVAAYVASGDPYDKAGGYSIQHAQFEPVVRFTGCHLGVIGLPVCIVAALLGVATAPDLGADGACRWSPRCTPPYPHIAARLPVAGEGGER